MQRAFAQKLSNQHAADVRKEIISTSREPFRGSFNPYDIVDPLDFEEFITQHQSIVEKDLLRPLLEFPSHDVELCIVPRKIRTQEPQVPKEPFSELPVRVKDCLKCYTKDWVVVYHPFRQNPSLLVLQTRESILQNLPLQEFEVDLDSGSSNGSICGEEKEASPKTRRSSPSTVCNTPRGSWASFDLLNSVSDPLIPVLLQRVPADSIDQINQLKRSEGRQNTLFLLYPTQDIEDHVERRITPDLTVEQFGHRILVKCLQLKLELEVEPIFASLALYDAKEKKKASENFYFDLNPESVNQMLTSHVPFKDQSTLSRSCIFNISHNPTDLFLVIKLEKVLQGDIKECAEPYIKDEKLNLDKVKQNAVASCERLGKYRMPFAWTAVYFMNVINGVNNGEHESLSSRDSVSSSSSLERKLSGSGFDQLRKRATEVGNSLSRRGSLERRNSNSLKRLSWSSDQLDTNLESFRPVTITVSSFFKQESDKLRDEDLYKFLQELKRPASVLKKLKCIPGSLKLDISPCPEEMKNSLTPELCPLGGFIEEKSRPTKEILEFPIKEMYTPHYQYRDLLFVYPKELNFSGRTGSARNIAVKIQLMCGEEEHQALPVIFGKSSCPEFTAETYTIVNYHNKTPFFYDEIKIALPANLNDQHHLLFTFYHISCQRKAEQTAVEVPVGYSWLPLIKDDSLQTGEYCLPVTMEHPPLNYSYITPDVHLPGIKWVDHHKNLFSVIVDCVSSVHSQDKYIEQFINLCACIENGQLPSRVTESTCESELIRKILNLNHAQLEPLVKFLPVILDKLLLFFLQPPCYKNTVFNVSSTIFEALGLIVKNIKTLTEIDQDLPGRHSLLTSYVAYQCTIPHPPADLFYVDRIMPVNSPDCTPTQEDDTEVTSFMKLNENPPVWKPGAHLARPTKYKLLHEELLVQWMSARSSPRDHSMENAWFFFDLMVKSMVEHLSAVGNINAPRKTRFPTYFLDDIEALVLSFTSDIINYNSRDSKLITSINASLAFFILDLFSIMDRGFVLMLVGIFYREVTSKLCSCPEDIMLFSLKLDFLRIVSSHEHFIALNLPFGTPFTSTSAPVSPTPSVGSLTSQSSFISSLLNKDKVNFTELSPEFRQQHYLIGLVLQDLRIILDGQNSNLQLKIVNLVRNLFTSHDLDPRLAKSEYKARVAALYIPFLSIIMKYLCCHSDPEASLYLSGDEAEPRSSINQSVAMAIAGTSMFGVKTAVADNYKMFHKVRKNNLSHETMRNILICFLWVIKNMDREIMFQWWRNLPSSQLKQLLEVLDTCISYFEYKGKKVINHSNKQKFMKSQDIKSRLEDVILGQGSVRNEFITRKKGDRLRWRKEQVLYKGGSDSVAKTKSEVGFDAHVESILSTEVSFIVLDILEQIVQMSAQVDHFQSLLTAVLKVLLHALSRNQSTCVLFSMFATQRSIVFKFPNLLFDEETEYCADLCLQLLKHSCSNVSNIRSQAAGSLYLLMRQNFEIGNNFARVKMQVTISLSSLVGTSQTFNEASLRRSLKTILLYSEEDHELQDTTFPEQVKDLVFNLHMILSDTVKMKEFSEDPEMLLDLMYRIARGYQNSPDLRLTWLANMAQKHMERNNHSEAAMCLIHSAALVAEYLHMLENQKHLPMGAVDLERITPNALEECAVSDDVLSPEEEGVCLGKDFTESGFIGLLEHAASSFYTAGVYEAMNEVYQVVIPICTKNKDFKKLANIHGKLHDAFIRLEQLHGKRMFGTYFRVGFYGSKFGDLNGEEFIYKEQALTKLPEIFSRLENFYGERFGSKNVIIIKDSNSVDVDTLDSTKAYIQITYVEPYFDQYEERYRRTHFDKNFNIRRFMFATPFTTNGKAHGELHEQYKRKTILTVANHFPYVKTRIQVVSRKQIVLTPIEVAIEDIQKKTMELEHSIKQDPPDSKILQMVLQGCIGTTVNQGPMEMATTFLSELLDCDVPPTKLQNKLRLCFKDFSKKCSDALRKNKNLIGPDQREYQRELERNYHRFTDKLMPLITLRKVEKFPSLNSDTSSILKDSVKSFL
nr:PREDICTED: dedicator of cytokinesis protein 7 [Bemisia tabaci]